MFTTAEQLDQELARWDSNLRTALENLIELKKVDAFEALFGPTPWVTLQGETKKRVEPVLNDFNDLWTHFSLVQKEIERAKKLRASQRKPNSALIEQLNQILCGASIELPPVAIPLQQRGLLSPKSINSNKLSVSDLMQALANSFDKAREMSFAISDAWSKLQPQLTRLQGEAKRLRELADSLGAKTPDELSNFESQLKSCQDAIVTDPLGASDDYESRLNPLIDGVRTSLELMKVQKDGLVSGLTAAGERLNGVKFTRAQVDAKYQEACFKVFNPDGLVPLDDRSAVDDFEERLATINEFNADGDYVVATRALSAWNSQMLTYEKELSRRLEANEKPLLFRDDLRGKLTAFQAKAFDLKLVEIDELAEVARKAKAAILECPTDLAAAEKLVSQYELLLQHYAARSNG